jgi:branched-chain amino acid transport system permease protein
MTESTQISSGAAPKSGFLPSVAINLSICIGIAALLLMPWLSSSYMLFLACLCGVNVIAAIGLNITTGYTGLLSIGHAAFVAIGAYVTAIMLTRWDVSLPICILASGVAAGAVGGLFGLPSLRIKGAYLAIATLSAQFIVVFILREGGDITGGDRGIVVTSPQFAGFRLDSNARIYFAILVVTVLTAWIARNLFKTKIGRALIAVRERDYTAEVLGINPVRYKLAGFVIGAFYAGVSGALLAGFLRIVTPDQFQLAQSIFYLAAIVVGGMGSILGSIVGALFMTLVPELLRVALDVLQETFGFQAAAVLAPLRDVIFGAMIVGFLIFQPRGLAGLIERAIRSLTGQRRTKT